MASRSLPKLLPVVNRSLLSSDRGVKVVSASDRKAVGDIDEEDVAVGVGDADTVEDVAGGGGISGYRESSSPGWVTAPYALWAMTGFPGMQLCRSASPFLVCRQQDYYYYYYSAGPDPTKVQSCRLS